MNLWTSLLHVLILLATAMLFGALLERLKQNALNLIPNHEAVTGIAVADARALGISLVVGDATIIDEEMEVGYRVAEAVRQLVN